MKKIALILAALMMFSAVSVLAAPSVEYIFYGVDEETQIPAYFVFGKYSNTYTTYKGVTTNNIAEDVGVYYKGNKYSYVKDGNTTNATGLFGIAFDDIDGIKDRLNSFEVKPYSVSNFGETLGVSHAYDIDNNQMSLPSNNYLASVSIERQQDGRGTAMALMEPAFDPDTEEYTIYGYFGNQYNKLSDVKLYFTAEDPKAQITIPAMVTNCGEDGYIGIGDNKDSAGNYLNYQLVTVTAQNGETKEYKFNFETTNTNSYYTGKTNVLRPTAYSGEKVENGEYTSPTNGVIYTYPNAGKDTSQYLIYTFPITDAMKNASAFSINTSNITGADFGNLKNVVLVARAYDATAENKLGTIGGKYVIPDSSIVPASGTTSCICGIDVTKILEEAIEAKQTQVQIAFQILSCESYGAISAPGLTFTHRANIQGTANARGVYLCWK